MGSFPFDVLRFSTLPRSLLCDVRVCYLAWPHSRGFLDAAQVFDDLISARPYSRGQSEGNDS